MEELVLENLVMLHLVWLLNARVRKIALSLSNAKILN